MPTSLLQYEMLPTTWFYLSSLIILAIFFRFNRFWSVRNLDLIGLVLFGPGLIWLAMSDDTGGYIWLLVVTFLISFRLLFDNIMSRRPLLEPNLTPGGLGFACFFLLAFVAAALLVNRNEMIDTERTLRLEQVLTARHIMKNQGMNPKTLTFPPEELANLPPGYRPFWSIVEQMNLILAPPKNIYDRIIPPPLPPTEDGSSDSNEGIPTSAESESTVAIPPPLREESALPTGGIVPSTPTSVQSPLVPKSSESESEQSQSADEPFIAPAKTGTIFLTMSLAIGGHFLMALGFLCFGHLHFGNIRTGVSCAALYLLLPYTNQMVGRLDHLIPAVLLLWAFILYRRPIFSGLLIGTAAALVTYPMALVPLWISFYWKKGAVRFIIGVSFAMTAFVFLLFFSPASLGTYMDQLLHLFGKSALMIFSRPEGIWTWDDMIYRMPVMSAYFVLCFGLFLWPSHKNLGTLIACSTLLLLTVQFWQLHQGGLYMAWYLPPLILTVFRPNLEDRVAQSSVVV